MLGFRFEPNTTEEQNKKDDNIQKCSNLIFDIVAMIVSASDLITDVIVLIHFYTNNHMEFFWISLTVIALAQISYVFAFIVMNSDESSPIKTVLLVLLLLPIAPFLSFIFYLTTDSNQWLSEFLEDHSCFDLNFGSPPTLNQDRSALYQWMQMKLRKHIGFIMEALIEAFPQSILQMVAIIYYDDANVISIISILISMISVSSKSFIFAINFSFNFKTLLFNWGCCVIDFFSIFFAISWVFYDNGNANDTYSAVYIVSMVWKYKVMVVVVSTCFALSVPLYWIGFRELSKECMPSYYPTDTPIYFKILIYFCSFLVITFFWAFGMLLGTLALEIASLLYIALPMFLFGSMRMPNNNEKADAWMDLLQWLKQSKSKNKNDGNDLCVRICCVNSVLIANWKEPDKVDKKLKKYIEFKEKETSFVDVKMSDIRNNYDDTPDPESDDDLVIRPTIVSLTYVFMFAPFYIIKSEYSRKSKAASGDAGIFRFWLGYTMFWNFIFGPLYYCSRVLNILFPFIIVICLYIDDVNIFLEIDLFQLCMLCVQLLLVCILTVIAIQVFREQYILFHICPLESVRYHIDDIAKMHGLIIEKYEEITVIPKRNAMLKTRFGIDIANLIIHYTDAITNDALKNIDDHDDDDGEIQTGNTAVEANEQTALTAVVP